MHNTGHVEFSDRRKAAAAAKTASVQAYRAARTASAPQREANLRERAAVAKAREIRRVQREHAKLEERVRLDTESAAREAQKAALEAVELDARAKANAAEEAAQKAKRDLRYASRKARSN